MYYHGSQYSTYTGVFIDRPLGSWRRCMVLQYVRYPVRSCGTWMICYVRFLFFSWSSCARFEHIHILYPKIVFQDLRSHRELFIVWLLGVQIYFRNRIIVIPAGFPTSTGWQFICAGLIMTNTHGSLWNSWDFRGIESAIASCTTT